ncbi:hypothetical protein Tco_0750004 [Tanacetum coccineum]|uniref:Uncharacterized protein n=1 Tax=Tanacetum coccineum TaxID=301880 RepID=A0ABQ4Z378_9ASTR
MFIGLEALVLDHSPKKGASSANCKSEMFFPLLARHTPLNIPVSQALRMVTWRASATRRKRKGDKGSHCLRPRSIKNSLDGEPLIRTDIEADERLEAIQFLHLGPKLICLIMSRRIFQFTLSKAFSNSTLKSKIRCSLRLAIRMISLATRQPSRIRLPLKKADWLWLMMLPITFARREARSFDIDILVRVSEFTILPLLKIIITKEKTSRTGNTFTCTHYGEEGHIKIRCYEDIGYPEWWDFTKKPRKKISQATVATSSQSEEGATPIEAHTSAK